MMVVMMVMLTAMNAGQMSNVHSLIFFSKGGLLQGWRFAREVVFSHPEVFAHKLLLRTEVFKHKKNVHRHFSRQKCLRTEICAHTQMFTHRIFYTQNILHT